ncbi:MAG: hypothetical protein FJX11_00880 [Alphaproteobacteria bacterium]|nr:hypothetical protein [Alphaproteobacteria bacterium]
MRIRAVLAAIVWGLLMATAGQAQDCAPAGRPINPDYQRDSADDWREEAQRIKSHELLASRRHDRLQLVLDGGKTLELVDCPFGEGARWYLYERYDRPGGFHVVRTVTPDDFSYTLVILKSGRQFTVHSSPVWPPDRSRFVTVACSIEPARGTLSIQAPAGGSLATEAEFPLPCERESCSARWDHESWISVTCAPREASAKKGTEFVLMRGKDGAWNKFGR